MDRPGFEPGTSDSKGSMDKLNSSHVIRIILLLDLLDDMSRIHVNIFIYFTSSRIIESTSLARSLVSGS